MASIDFDSTVTFTTPDGDEVHFDTSDTYSELVAGYKPLVYYRLGEAPGSTIAVDSSGNGVDGDYIVSNSVLGSGGLVIDDPDTSVYFNGASDRVDFDDAGELVDITKPWSVSFIYKQAATNSRRAICELRTNSTSGFVIEQGSAKLYFSGDDSKTVFAAFQTPSLTFVGNYDSVVVIFDGVDASAISSYTVYVNGISKTLSNRNPWGTGSNLYNALGNFYHTGYASWGGSLGGLLDEFALFDYDLSVSQVDHLNYKAKAFSVPPVLYSSYPELVLGLNPVSYHRLGETLGSTVAIDETGNHAGTYTNSPTLEVEGALYQDNGTGMTLAGGSSDEHMVVSTDTAFNVPHFTSSFFLKVPDATAPDYEFILGKSAYTTWADGWGVMMLSSNSIMRFFINNWGTSTKYIEVPISYFVGNGWNHFTCTYDGAYLKVYINGNLKESKALVDTIVYSSTPYTVGTPEVNLTDSFEGSLAEVAFFDYALQAAEIKQLALHREVGAYTRQNISLEPYIQLRLGEATGPAAGIIAVDLAGNHEGLCYNDPTVGQTGLIPYHDTDTCVSFDGVDQGIRAPSVVTSDLNITVFSMSAVIQVSSNPVTYPNLITALGSGAVTNRALFLRTDGKISFKAYATSGSATVTSPTAIDFDIPVHIVGVAAPGGLKLYIDGVKVAEETNFNGSPNNHGNSFFEVGHKDGFSSSTLDFFEGEIDEPTLYLHGLTSLEANALYRSGFVEDSYAEYVLGLNPIAYYRLNENVGTVAYDSSGNAYDGTYTTPSLGEDGLLVDDTDNSVDFTGNTWMATTGSPTATDDFTISFLIHPDNVSGHNPIIGANGTSGDGIRLYNTDLTFDGYEGFWIGRPITALETHHVVIARRGSEIYLFLDGQQPTHNGSVATDTTITLDTIGTVYPSWGISFDGRIDEVCMFDYALDDYDAFTLKDLAFYPSKLVNDNFIGSDGDTPNTALWEYYEEGGAGSGTAHSETIQANELELSLTGTITTWQSYEAGLRSTYEVEGDFDLQITYMDSSLSSNGCYSAFSVYDSTNDSLLGRISRRSSGLYFKIGAGSGTASTAAGPRTWRWVRVGTSLSLYHKDPDSSLWYQISTSQTVTTNNVFITVSTILGDAGNGDPSGIAQLTYFDNFIVSERDDIVLPPAPGEATGSGSIADVVVTPPSATASTGGVSDTGSGTVTDVVVSAVSASATGTSNATATGSVANILVAPVNGVGIVGTIGFDPTLTGSQLILSNSNRTVNIYSNTWRTSHVAKNLLAGQVGYIEYSIDVAATYTMVGFAPDSTRTATYIAAAGTGVSFGLFHHVNVTTLRIGSVDHTISIADLQDGDILGFVFEYDGLLLDVYLNGVLSDTIDLITTYGLTQYTTPVFTGASPYNNAFTTVRLFPEEFTYSIPIGATAWGLLPEANPNADASGSVADVIVSQISGQATGEGTSSGSVADVVTSTVSGSATGGSEGTGVGSVADILVSQVSGQATAGVSATGQLADISISQVSGQATGEGTGSGLVADTNVTPSTATGSGDALTSGLVADVNVVAALGSASAGLAGNATGLVADVSLSTVPSTATGEGTGPGLVADILISAVSGQALVDETGSGPVADIVVNTPSASATGGLEDTGSGSVADIIVITPDAYATGGLEDTGSGSVADTIVVTPSASATNDSLASGQIADIAVSPTSGETNIDGSPSGLVADVTVSTISAVAENDSTASGLVPDVSITATLGEGNTGTVAFASVPDVDITPPEMFVDASTSPSGTVANVIVFPSTSTGSGDGSSSGIAQDVNVSPPDADADNITSGNAFGFIPDSIAAAVTGIALGFAVASGAVPDVAVAASDGYADGTVSVNAEGSLADVTVTNLTGNAWIANHRTADGVVADVVVVPPEVLIHSDITALVDTIADVNVTRTDGYAFSAPIPRDTLRFTTEINRTVRSNKAVTTAFRAYNLTPMDSFRFSVTMSRTQRKTKTIETSIRNKVGLL